MFTRCNKLALPVWILLATKVVTNAAVGVNITTSDDSDTPLPSDIRVIVSTDTNTTTVFNLSKVEHIDANVPVYSIDTNKDGALIVNKETEPEDKVKDVAFYQDLRNGAVMQIARLNDGNARGMKLAIDRGEYVKNNVRYAITPRRRNKRDVLSEVDNQSNQSYDIVEIPSPKFPDINSFSKPVPSTQTKESLAVKQRKKRQSETTLYVDVTAFLDYSRYNKFLIDASYSPTTALKNIQEYYAFIFSNIDLIYQNYIANNYRLRVTLTKIVAFKSSTAFPLVYLPYSIDYYQYKSRVDTLSVLDKFSKLLNSPAGRDLAYPYDHAMIFIGSDLWLGTSFSWYAVDLLGLASNISTLCSEDGTSSTAVEDAGDYSAALIGAHELGHILSARHDGDKNTCNFTDRYLMASSDSEVTNTTSSHPWQFSNCTLNYFVSFINSMLQTTRGQSCLSNTLDVIGEFPDVSNRYLGQEIPPGKQCKLTYGSSSYQCSSQKTPNICYQLYCYAAYSCETYYVPALAGTTCGCGKVCRQGECVFDLHSPDASCDIWNNCTSVNCSDDMPYLYCKLTCNVQLRTTTMLDTTTRSTTEIFTTPVPIVKTTATTAPRTTSLTRKSTTTPTKYSTTDCHYGQRCSTVSSCKDSTCGAGTIDLHPYNVIFIAMPYAIAFLYH